MSRLPRSVRPLPRLRDRANDPLDVRNGAVVTVATVAPTLNTEPGDEVVSLPESHLSLGCID